MTAVPARVAIARIIDPTAWTVDRDGFTVEHVHSGEALMKADAILEMQDGLRRLPASPPALLASIAQIEDFSESGLHLGEIENEVSFTESVLLCVHELMRLQEASVWPPLSPVLREVLGFMCFQLGAAAHVYRAAGEFVDGDGEPLKSRAEDEQAFMLHKFVGWALTHGAGWSEVASTDLKRVRAVAEARKVDGARS